MKRLNLLKSSKHFTSCTNCGFTYMPFSKHAAENCPKCEPQNEAYVDEDKLYLENEAETYSQVVGY